MSSIKDKTILVMSLLYPHFSISVSKLFIYKQEIRALFLRIECAGLATLEAKLEYLQN